MGYLRQLFWLSAVYNFRFTASYVPECNSWCSVTVHQPLKCLEFYEHLCSQTPRPVVDGIMLSNQMSPNSQEHLCSRLPGFWDGQKIAEQLQFTDHIPIQKTPKLPIAPTGTATFAFVSTWDTPPPAPPAHICEYAAFLARTLQATSVPNYLNIISIVHKESNLPNPLSNNWALQSLLTGIKRVKGQPPAKKLPITPDVLKKIIYNWICLTDLMPPFGLSA